MRLISFTIRVINCRRLHSLKDVVLKIFSVHLIDSEINCKRYFIKIPVMNKGIDFIDLSSIFKHRYVTSSIPDYFENQEPPVICYKHNTPIRNTIFNFNKLVSDSDIHINTPDT